MARERTDVVDEQVFVLEREMENGLDRPEAHLDAIIEIGGQAHDGAPDLKRTDLIQ